MLKGRKKELRHKADAERQRCRKWLLDYMRPGQPMHVMYSGNVFGYSLTFEKPGTN
jgi:hypothetical protein